MGVDKSTVQKVLKDALAAVEAAEIPDDLRPVAFGKAVELLAGDAPSPPSRRVREGGGAGGDAGDGGGGDDRLAKIAKRMAVDESKLSYVYDLDEDDVNIIIPRSKLGSGKATGTKEVALLYCAARQAAGYDETHTVVEAVRERAEDMGVYDNKNFATHMKNVDGLTMKGSGQSRAFKVTNPGYEESGKLVNRLTGGGS